MQTWRSSGIRRGRQLYEPEPRPVRLAVSVPQGEFARQVPPAPMGVSVQYGRYFAARWLMPRPDCAAVVRWRDATGFEAR